MTEFDEREQIKTQRAIAYIDKMLKGINPVDGSDISGDSVINDVKVRNCFKFILDVLGVYDEALEGVEDSKRSHNKKTPFNLSINERLMIPITDERLRVSVFARKINTLIDGNTMKSLKSTAINKWLLRKGFLKIVTTKDGKEHKWPTEEGMSIGISKEKFFTKDNILYYSVLFDRNAQQFIADNIGEIIDINNEKSKKNKSE